MADINGHTHRNMLPVGKMSPEIWSTQLAYARLLLPPPFIELIEKTKQPFISVVNDHVSPRASFFDGKLLLVGDALSQFRPHAALSTNQAALHALSLVKVMKREMSVKRWEDDVLRYAKATTQFSTAIGDFGQSGMGAFLTSVVRYLVCILGQKISGLRRQSQVSYEMEAHDLNAQNVYLKLSNFWNRYSLLHLEGRIYPMCKKQS